MFVRRMVYYALVALTLTACAGSAVSVMLYEDVPRTGDASRGEVLFNEAVGIMPTCVSCHYEGANAAPYLADYAAVAGERVADVSAHEYTFYAIAEPSRHIAEGYGNAMYNKYDNTLTPQDIADLIAYLLES